MWPYKTGDLLKKVQFICNFLWKDKKNVAFKYRWSLNRGDHMDRFDCISLSKEESEDTKGVIRICKSRNSQHNGQKKKDKWTNNDLHYVGTVFCSNIIETCTADLSPTRSMAPSTHVIHYDQRPGFPYINLVYHHRRPHPLSVTTAGTGQLREIKSWHQHESPIEG